MKLFYVFSKTYVNQFIIETTTTKWFWSTLFIIHLLRKSISFLNVYLYIHWNAFNPSIVFYFALTFNVNSILHLIWPEAISIPDYAYKRFFPVYHNFRKLKYLKCVFFIHPDKKKENKLPIETKIMKIFLIT